jgi:hypothetical protein
MQARQGPSPVAENGIQPSRAPASLSPKTAAFPSYTKIIFRAADRPKPQKCSSEIRKKRPRADDDFAVAFVPLESESARTRQQFLHPCSKDSISKNSKQRRTTKHSPRTLKAAGAAIDTYRELTHLMAGRFGGNTMATAIFGGIEIDTDGDVDLRDSAIAVLPDNLTVGGSLFLSRTAITVLPDNLTVGGKIYGLESDITPALADEMCGGRAP